MNIILSQYFSIEIEQKAYITRKISDILTSYFSDKSYGNDLEEMIICIICVSKKFEPFFKPRRPKYIKEKKIIVSNLTKQPYEIERSLEYDFKIDFEIFKNASEKESEKILALEILLSLDTIDSVKKKIKDFDWETFRIDLESCFKEKGLI